MDQHGIAFSDPSDCRHIWCRYSGEGRGDCEHAIGVPDILDETTTDEYGIPHGWCDYCWMSHQAAEKDQHITNLEADIARYQRFEKEVFGKPAMPINIIFDGPPPGKFVEVETDDGKSICAGEWIELPSGHWTLRITALPAIA